MSLAAARSLNGIGHLLKQRIVFRRDEIFIVDRHRVIAGIPLRADEP